MVLVQRAEYHAGERIDDGSGAWRLVEAEAEFAQTLGESHRMFLLAGCHHVEFGRQPGIFGRVTPGTQRLVGAALTDCYNRQHSEIGRRVTHGRRRAETIALRAFVLYPQSNPAGCCRYMR